MSPTPNGFQIPGPASGICYQHHGCDQYQAKTFINTYTYALSMFRLGLPDSCIRHHQAQRTTVEASETADPSPLLIRGTASKPARPAIWFPLPSESGGYTWFWKGICLDGHDAGNSSIIVRHRKPRRRTQRGRIQRAKSHAYCTILYRDIERHTCATNCNVFGQRHVSHGLLPSTSY
jgi:hypothetical protein